MPTTRRDFLSAALGSTTVISVGTAVPAFLLQAAAAEPEPRRNTVLVVIQLTGGNDGLNTVVPYTDEVYRKNRPELAIGRGQVLKVDSQVGLHPAMEGFDRLLQSNQLCIIQGVGYPNPNRSHFESMDIWHTCHRQSDGRTSGWLGRYLDAASDSTANGDLAGLHLGTEQRPLALAAHRLNVPSIQSLARFRLQDLENSRLARTLATLSQRPSGPTDDLLGFVRSSTRAALSASQRVEEASQEYTSATKYPGSPLAQKLRTVAQLIDADLGARVFYVELDGFDTHSVQADAHAGLLKQLSDATAAFLDDVTQHGHGQRVLVMTFSEFGRRVKENASQGTDHGEAAPMFLAGERVEAGLVGHHPSLTDLADGDLKHSIDFRQVYSTILEDWLGWKSVPILGDRYQPIRAVKALTSS